MNYLLHTLEDLKEANEKGELYRMVRDRYYKARLICEDLKSSTGNDLVFAEETPTGHENVYVFSRESALNIYIRRKKEINWEKAMKNGAWGSDVIFKEDEKPGKLMGWMPNTSCFMIARPDGFTTILHDCRFPDDFEIPENWLK